MVRFDKMEGWRDRGREGGKELTFVADVRADTIRAVPEERGHIVHLKEKKGRREGGREEGISVLMFT